MPWKGDGTIFNLSPLTTLYLCCETDWAEGVVTLSRAGSDGYVLTHADSYLLIFHNPNFLENTAFTWGNVHEPGTHMELCCLSVWLQEGNHLISSFILACICIHLWFHYHQNSIAAFKPLWRNINRDISAVMVTLEQNQAITLAPSQAPTYKFSAANLHKNTCTICFIAPVQSGNMFALLWLLLLLFYT